MTSLSHLIMHATAIKRNGKTDEISSIAGLEKQTAAEALEKAVSLGRLVQVDDTYLLSPAGRMILDSEYSRFCYEIRADEDFVNSYNKFEAINRNLKQLLTEWQTVEVGGHIIPNDHSDSDYDERIIDRLGAIHDQFEPILGRMISRIGRFEHYKFKLINALEKAEDGDIDWVSDARIESYHTVWFELHEDLLRLLGQTRED